MKKITVYISVYTSIKDLELLLKYINSTNLYNCKLIVFNDNPSQLQKFEFNNPNYSYYTSNINLGKFWRIINSINDNIIDTEFFITIDPDDLLLESINFEILQKLINAFDYIKSRDFFINSYFLKDSNKIKKKNIFNTSVFLTPNLIYNANNIRKEVKHLGLNFEGHKLSYYEDKLLNLLTSNEQNYKYLNFPFYTYNKYLGMTKDKSNYKDEIEQAQNILDKILKNKKNVDFCKRIKKYTISKFTL